MVAVRGGCVINTFCSLILLVLHITFHSSRLQGHSPLSPLLICFCLVLLLCVFFSFFGSFALCFISSQQLFGLNKSPLSQDRFILALMEQTLTENTDMHTKNYSFLSHKSSCNENKSNYQAFFPLLFIILQHNAFVYAD